jgi:hypothetical protein
MGRAVGQGEESLPDAEAGTALAQNLARQREIALGKRVVNTQGPESIALADEKYRKPEDDGNWMA